MYIEQRVDSWTATAGRFRSVVQVQYDDSPSPPSELGDCEPDLFRAETPALLEVEVGREFGVERYANRCVAALANGKVVKTAEGDWFYGVSEYRHSGSALALCQSASHRQWPDQQWDVIHLVGWVKISRELRKRWGIHGRRGVNELAKKNAEGALNEWQAYINGHVYGWVVTVAKLEDYLLHQDVDLDDLERYPGEVVDEESCWGFYNQDDVLSDALAMAQSMKSRHGNAACARD